MKKFMLMAMLGLLCITGRAQVVIRPGKELIHAELIRPSHDFYRCRVKDTTGKLIYDFMMEDLITIDTANKQITFARYRQIPIGEFSTDTSITDLRFKPIRMHEIHYQRETFTSAALLTIAAFYNFVRGKLLCCF